MFEFVRLPASLAVLFVLLLGAASAFAEEGSDALPPPPLPPAPAWSPSAFPPPAPALAGAMLEDEAPSGEAPGEAPSAGNTPASAEGVQEGASPDDDPCDFPAPALRPCDICPPVCCPKPCAPCGPRLENNTACCWPRDDCGWALGPCGGRIGRTTIAVEGAFSLFTDMDGLVGEAVPAGTPALSWDPNSYDGEFGGRLSLRHAFTPRDKIEARGVWYGEFDKNTTQTGALGFSPGGPSPVLPGARLANESEAVSFELNWWHEVCCKGNVRWSVVVGLRYLNLEERARVDWNIGAVAPVPAFAASEVETNFLAGQLGGRVDWLLGRLEVGLSGKALLGSLEGDIDVSDRSVFVVGNHAVSQSKSDFGFGAEAEVSILHRVTRNFAISFGYTLLFVNDVVRAHDAMDFSQAGTGAVQIVQDKSALLIHTFTVGFELSL